jgi:parallel beta-helix repeat protein
MIDDSSDNNVISWNTIDNNGNGIYLDDSSGTVMRNNTIQNNTYNFDVYGNNINEFYHNIDTSNIINGKPIYYLIEQSMLLIDNTMSIGYLALISCTNIRLDNIILANNRQGLLLVNTCLSTITNLTLCNNDQCGIWLSYSSNNIFIGNNINNNGIGIGLRSSDNNIITGNNVTDNNFHGILLEGDSDNNNISGNTIAYNRLSGIWLSYSSNNNIIRNSITDNNDYGIRLYGSSDNNIIYHNNFINNYQNAYDGGSNTWDNSYPSGGNFWSDYNGTDDDGDGIGDAPYPIPGGDNLDSYPLGNFKPDPPDIDGPSTGSPGKSYCFTFHSINPNGDNIKYFIDWGDDTSEETPLVSSCKPIKHYHTWTEEGNFKIKAKATDIYGAESNWSEFEISIPRSKTSSYLWFECLLDCFPLLERLLNIIF